MEEGTLVSSNGRGLPKFHSFISFGVVGGFITKSRQPIKFFTLTCISFSSLDVKQTKSCTPVVQLDCLTIKFFYAINT